MDLGRPLASSLGIGRLRKNPASETGGAFLTMRDNASLSGSRDTDGTATKFGAGQAIAFVPKLDDLRADPAGAAAVADIERMVARAVALFGLTDYFSVDFRLGDDGLAYFLEFEVCPAVTIFDFQTYLKTAYGLGLGPALAQSVARAARRPPDP
jgi:D-alanine-D-alanine ligase